MAFSIRVLIAAFLATGHVYAQSCDDYYRGFYRGRPNPPPVGVMPSGWAPRLPGGLLGGLRRWLSPRVRSYVGGEVPIERPISVSRDGIMAVSYSPLGENRISVETRDLRPAVPIALQEADLSVWGRFHRLDRPSWVRAEDGRSSEADNFILSKFFRHRLSNWLELQTVHYTEVAWPGDLFFSGRSTVFRIAWPNLRIDATERARVAEEVEMILNLASDILVHELGVKPLYELVEPTSLLTISNKFLNDPYKVEYYYGRSKWLMVSNDMVRLANGQEYRLSDLYMMALMDVMEMHHRDRRAVRAFTAPSLD